MKTQEIKKIKVTKKAVKVLSVSEILKINPMTLGDGEQTPNYIERVYPELYNSREGKDCRNGGRIATILYLHKNKKIPLNKKIDFTGLFKGGLAKRSKNSFIESLGYTIEPKGFRDSGSKRIITEGVLRYNGKTSLYGLKKQATKKQATKQAVKKTKKS